MVVENGFGTHLLFIRQFLFIRQHQVCHKKAKFTVT